MKTIEEKYSIGMGKQCHQKKIDGKLKFKRCKKIGKVESIKQMYKLLKKYPIR